MEIENQELKGKLKLLMKKEKSSSENTKNQIESLEFNLRKEIESLTRKISSLEDSLKRKNKEIGEKDKFMTGFLLPKVKEDTGVEKIMEEMSNYFK